MRLLKSPSLGVSRRSAFALRACHVLLCQMIVPNCVWLLVSPRSFARYAASLFTRVIFKKIISGLWLEGFRTEIFSLSYIIILYYIFLGSEFIGKRQSIYQQKPRLGKGDF